MPRKKLEKIKGVCRYSDNCFECPLPDCKCSMDDVITVNKLPWDYTGKNWDNENLPTAAFRSAKI